MLEIEMTDTFRPVRQRSQIWLQKCSIQMGRVRPGFVHASATRETCPIPQRVLPDVHSTVPKSHGLLLEHSLLRETSLSWTRWARLSLE